jgi:hypothetical protein
MTRKLRTRKPFKTEMKSSNSQLNLVRVDLRQPIRLIVPQEHIPMRSGFYIRREIMEGDTPTHPHGMTTRVSMLEKEVVQARAGLWIDGHGHHGGWFHTTSAGTIAKRLLDCILNVHGIARFAAGHII